MSVASPRQHVKAKNAKKPRLTPKQCREVTDHWKSCLGKDEAKILVGKYTNPTRLTKGAMYRVQGNLTRHLQQDLTVSAAHSNTGGRRNPGRNDGLAWNGDSFICTRQIEADSDYTDFDPFSDICPICEEHYNQEARVRRPRTVEISLADIPMKVGKPRQRKAHDYEALPPVPQATHVPSSALGERTPHQNFETLSNFSWDAVTSDITALSEDWEDLESAYAHDSSDHELGHGPEFQRVAQGDSPATPPQRTYAQALAEQLEGLRK